MQDGQNGIIMIGIEENVFYPLLAFSTHKSIV
jgi:hypothetical protein